MRHLVLVLVLTAAPALAFAQSESGRSPFHEPPSHALAPPPPPTAPTPAPAEAEQAPESAEETAAAIASELRAAAHAGYPLRATGDGGYSYDDKVRFTANIAPDGQVEFDDHFSFDLTDLVMHARHQDPYSYEKAQFLAATFELRALVAAHAGNLAMRRALSALPGYLESVWRDPRRSAKERTRLLWELSDECDLGSAGGRAARDIIDGFIRTRAQPPLKAQPVS
ncbi:MAG TPA: hypothetical protein VKN99_23090 [Polyangia bacterium]|nr:hypothetical protein [Polyangia bacterium]